MTSATDTTTEARGPFKSMTDIRHSHPGNWFDKGTMQWFNSRIESKVIYGRFFISSEQYDDETPRLYTIRYATDQGDIETLGEFQDYKTPAAARTALKKHLGR